MSNLKAHLNKWQRCKACQLHSTRCKVAQLRGTRVPCDVLFVGEAPGESEDTCGKPFVKGAPSGGMLQSWIDALGIESYAITNLIACIPRDPAGGKLTTPPAYAVKECARRLQQLVNICRPKLVVLVGKEAEKWWPKVIDSQVPTVAVLHPGSIIRANPAQRSLAQHRCLTILQDAMEDADIPTL